MTFTGTVRVVWGVPKDIRPIMGIPEGARVRLRFRNTTFGKAFIKHGGTTSMYALRDDGPTWGLIPQGTNAKWHRG